MRQPFDLLSEACLIEGFEHFNDAGMQGTSALVQAKSFTPMNPRSGAPCGASRPRKLVTDRPANVPRMPAGSCVLPPGLGPSIDVKSPSYVLTEQQRPDAFRQTRTLRTYVSNAHVLPLMPVSTSFWTRYDTAIIGLPPPHSGPDAASARTTGTRSPPMSK